MPLGQPYSISDSPRSVPLPMPWWYRGDAVTLVGSKASVVSDLSGNGRDSLQSIDANRWAWSAVSGPNGTPGLTGTGTQFSSTVSNVNLTTISQLTIIVVYKPSVLIATPAILVFNKMVPAPQGFFLDAFLFGGKDSYEALVATPTLTNSSLVQNSAALNSILILEQLYDQTIASNQTNAYINGVLQTPTRFGNDDTVGGFQNQPLCLGADAAAQGGGTLSTLGTIAECFAYAGLLTAQQRQNLYRGYLSPRYAIVVP